MINAVHGRPWRQICSLSTPPSCRRCMTARLTALGAAATTQRQQRDTDARASPAVTKPPCCRLSDRTRHCTPTAYGSARFAAATTPAASRRPAQNPSACAARLRLRRTRRTAPRPLLLCQARSAICGKCKTLGRESGLDHLRNAPFPVIEWRDMNLDAGSLLAKEVCVAHQQLVERTGVDIPGFLQRDLKVDPRCLFRRYALASNRDISYAMSGVYRCNPCDDGHSLPDVSQGQAHVGHARAFSQMQGAWINLLLGSS